MEQKGSCTLTKAACKSLFEQMLQAIDGQLSATEQHQVLATIAQHPCCFEKMTIVQSYKSFLCSKLERKPVPHDLIAAIKDKVSRLSSDTL